MSRREKNTGVERTGVLYFGPLGIKGGIGGSARLRNMLGILKKLDIQTRLISYLSDKKYEVTHQHLDDYLDATVISVPGAWPQLLKLPVPFLTLYYGLKYIGKSDLVMAHSANTAYGLSALLLARVFGKPLLIDLTDSRDPATPGFVYRFLLRRANTVFVVSRYLEEVAKKAGSRKVVHAPGFIDAGSFSFNVTERERIRAEYGIGSKEIAIGYAGAFAVEEGLPYLVKAFKELTARHGNIKLVLIGGKMAPHSDDIPGLIKELGIEDRVIIIPPQPYEMMPAYLSALDIACSPKIDCLVNHCADPIKIYEYMAVGLPTVASAVSETVNVIETGTDGFLVRPEDTDDLVKTLDNVIQNIGSFEDLKKKARNKVIGNYTQEVVLGKLEEALSSLLGDRQAGN